MSFNLGTQAVTDFNLVMTTYGQSYTVTRNTATVDTNATVSAITTTTFTITGMIQDISFKDRQIHDMGLATPGNRKLYAKADNSGNTIKVDDEITDQYSVQWRVVQILKQPSISSSEVYRMCVIKNLSLESST